MHDSTDTQPPNPSAPEPWWLARYHRALTPEEEAERKRVIAETEQLWRDDLARRKNRAADICRIRASTRRRRIAEEVRRALPLSVRRWLYRMIRREVHAFLLAELPEALDYLRLEVSRNGARTTR
jgi:hypothetical protein